MRHYMKEEWQAFHRGELSEISRREMEKHLLSCEICMNSFLESMPEEDIVNAGKMLPVDFTDSTMLYIKEKSRPEPPVCHPNTWRKRWQDLFVYYVAAAILTMFFAGGGVFQSLVDNYSQLSRTACSLEHQKLQDSIRMDWPGQIADRTARWIENFENRKKEGVSK